MLCSSFANESPSMLTSSHKTVSGDSFCVWENYLPFWHNDAVSETAPRRSRFIVSAAFMIPAFPALQTASATFNGWTYKVSFKMTAPLSTRRWRYTIGGCFWYTPTLLLSETSKKPRTQNKPHPTSGIYSIVRGAYHSSTWLQSLHFYNDLINNILILWNLW